MKIPAKKKGKKPASGGVHLGKPRKIKKKAPPDPIEEIVEVLEDYGRAKVQRIFDVAGEKIVAEFGSKIQAQLSTVVDARIAIGKEHLQSLIDAEFDKRVQKRLDTLTNTEFELIKVDFDTPLAKVTQYMTEGWRVLEMVSPSNAPEGYKHRAGIYLQRAKCKGQKASPVNVAAKKGKSKKGKAKTIVPKLGPVKIGGKK